MAGAQQGFQYPSPGAQDVASYMIAGLPWVSSSVIPSGSVWTINFPYVTSHLRVQNVGTGTSQLGVAFTVSGATPTGVANNRIYLNSATNLNDLFEAPCRVKTMYLVALTSNVTASVYAGLTQIVPWKFPTLTGSSDPGLSGSIPDPVFGYEGL